MRDRFKAWWTGEEIEAPKKSMQSALDIAIASAEDDPEDVDDNPWSNSSLSVIQALWGEGFIEPGGAKFTRSLLGWLSLNSKQSVLDLTAGLGGTARSVSSAHSLWMDVTESIPELIAEGRRQSVVNGMAKQVPLSLIDLENHNLSTSRYDAIYSRERLFSVKNKANLLAGCVEALKSKGQILITDYMRGPETGGAELAAEWGRHELYTPHPWTLKGYRDCFSGMDMDVLISQDISEEMIDHINSAWRRIPGMIAEGRFSRSQIGVLVREGEMWLDRMRAIESGMLIVGRIHVQNRPK